MNSPARLRLRPTRREAEPIVGDGLVPSRIQRWRVTNPGDHKGRPYGSVDRRGVRTLLRCKDGTRSRTLGTPWR